MSSASGAPTGAEAIAGAVVTLQLAAPYTPLNGLLVLDPLEPTVAGPGRDRTDEPRRLRRAH